MLKLPLRTIKADSSSSPCLVTTRPGSYLTCFAVPKSCRIWSCVSQLNGSNSCLLSMMWRSLSCCAGGTTPSAAGAVPLMLRAIVLSSSLSSSCTYSPWRSAKISAMVCRSPSRTSPSTAAWVASHQHFDRLSAITSRPAGNQRGLTRKNHSRSSTYHRIVTGSRPWNGRWKQGVPRATRERCNRRTRPCCNRGCHTLVICRATRDELQTRLRQQFRSVTTGLRTCSSAAVVLVGLASSGSREQIARETAL